MKYPKEDLQRLHQELYRTLAEIIRVCEVLDIPYFIQGGTAIGALYNKGISLLNLALTEKPLVDITSMIKTVQNQEVIAKPRLAITNTINMVVKQEAIKQILMA